MNRIDNYLEWMISRLSDRTKYNAMKFVKDFINKHKLTDEFLIDYCYDLEHNNPREKWKKQLKKNKMSKGYCNHSCKHFKYENVYETFEEKNSNGEVVMRWREYKGRKYYCDKCNDNYMSFMKDFDKNYCHKTSKWMSENVSMECYEPTDTTQLLDGMVSDLNTLLENIKNNKL